jgi:hypothetical protein
VLTRRRNDWGEDRVAYFDTHGKLRSIRASWTSLAEPDLFAQVSAGRSWFRIDDLLRLAAEVAELKARSRP